MGLYKTTQVNKVLDHFISLLSLWVFSILLQYTKMASQYSPIDAPGAARNSQSPSDDGSNYYQGDAVKDEGTSSSGCIQNFICW